MAQRYWVAGGTGNWNSTTNWSATSGGASGASFPTASDDVYFDANSGSGTATINVTSGCLSLNCTGFTGTLAGAGILTISGGNLTFGSGMTITWSGNLQFNVAGSTITANGKTITGLMIIASGFAAGGTITLSGTFQCGGFSHTVVSGTININGGDLKLAAASGTLLSTSGGRFLAGTSKVILAGTGTVNTGGISNNVDINTSGTITQSGAISVNGGTWTRVAGTWATGTSTFNIGGNCTLNLGGITLYALASAAAAAIVTINSHFYVQTSVTVTISTGFVFAGTHGFICQTLTTNSTSTGRAFTFAPNVEYIVTNKINAISGYALSLNSFSSSTPGVKAKLTLMQGATQYLANCNFTDIDASNGITLFTYTRQNGTISNCDNVKEIRHSKTTIGIV